MPKKKFNGKRIGYKISYYPVGRSCEIRNVTVNYRTNYTELTTNLTVFTEYVITVSAVSSGGAGPGNSTTARTNDEGKAMLTIDLRSAVINTFDVSMMFSFDVYLLTMWGGGGGGCLTRGFDCVHRAPKMYKWSVPARAQ